MLNIGYTLHELKDFFLNIDLEGADLRDANLSGSLLIDCDFRGADMRGTKFNNTDKRGARGLPIEDD